MIVWGSCHIECREESGQFPCPQCNQTQTYSVLRTYRYFHLFFIPLCRQEIVAEGVCCEGCGALLPVTFLAASAPTVASQFEASQSGDGAVSSSIGNVVALTERCAIELKRRHTAGGFGQDAVVRVAPGNASEYELLFDFAVANGQDWIGESQGLPVVVDRRDAPTLLGKTIDFQNGKFCDQG